MFCNQCGQELPERGGFCPNCGAPRESPPPPAPPAPKPPKKSPSKAGRIVPLVLVVLLAAVLVLQNFGVIPLLSASKSSGQRIEGDGYDSAEDAVLAYIDALKAGDVDEILSTFAVETYVDELDSEAMLERLYAYYPTIPLALVGTDYETALLYNQRAAGIASSLRQQLVFYAGQSEDVSMNLFAPFDGAEDVREFLDVFEKSDFPADLADMEFAEFMDPGEFSDAFFSDGNLENIRRNCEIYGCEELQPLAARVTLDGEDWVLAMDCAEYDGRWYNLNLSGNLGALLGVTADAGGLMPLF